MYETEANLIRISDTEIPSEILARFAESRKSVTRRTMIPWGEHCTECVWPTCYTTCDLYSPRKDGRCRRFVEGMVRVNCTDSLNSYLVKITFKRWAKLWATANLKLYALQAADREERRDFQIGRLIGKTPGSLGRVLTLKRYSMKKRVMRRAVSGVLQPNYLMIECYNSQLTPVSITLTVRRDGALIPYQALLHMEPGFSRHRVLVTEIEQAIDLSTPFYIELTPNELPEKTTLYFGAMDFVVDTAVEATLAPPKVKSGSERVCKCVVWDLDNTLWDGILIEDGPKKLRLKPGIVELLRQLDERGILVSVASKNNSEDALNALRRFGIDQYFLLPQISWEPKSRGIQRIAAGLNIGIDSLLFVDDSRFEREEVSSVCPEVMMLDALEYPDILSRKDCQLPVTEESRKRRLFYRDTERRESAQRDFHGKYITFLKECNLRLTIRPMTDKNLERVHELTQRTNQMNFSGNRYSREQLRNFLGMPEIETYVLDCEDRFGSYGTIGFCLMDRSEARMTDLMLSCRVQGKRVEHAFVSYLIRKYRQGGAGSLLVDYRKTKKNAGPGKVFDDLGFEVLEEANGITRLACRESNLLLDETIVTIEDETAQRTLAALVK
jgi:FkbH-like protein